MINWQAQGVKRLVCIVSGILTCFFACFIVVFIGTKLNFQVQTTFFFFFLPVGSSIIGILSGSGYTWSAKFLNMKIKALDYLFLIFLGLLAGFTIYISLYAMTSIDTEGNVIYSFSRGTHISNYALEGSNQPIDFTTYMKHQIGSRQFSFFSSYAGFRAIKIPKSPMSGWFFFIFEIFGYILGAVATKEMVLSEYCDSCKKYYRGRKRFIFNLEGAEDVINDIDACIKNRGDIFKTLAAHKEEQGSINLEFQGERCPGCGIGILKGKIKVAASMDIDDMDQPILEMRTDANKVIDSTFEKEAILDQISKFEERKGIDSEDREPGE